MSAKRRTLGPDGPSLSQVSYGSMRMAPDSARSSGVDLLLQLHEAGIDTHHSSFEYESYAQYCGALRVLADTGRHVHHIVKLAEPGFDDTTFSAQRFLAAIDSRLRELHTEQIAVLQWMCRTRVPTADHNTGGVLDEQSFEISELFAELRRSGKVASVAIFPYTTNFLGRADQLLGERPMCTYLSMFERQYVRLLSADRPFVALRPFAGAEPGVRESAEASALESRPERRHRAALEYPLLHPSVATAVVSVNQPAHVATAIDCALNVDANRTRFEQTTAALGLVGAGVA